MKRDSCLLKIWQAWGAEARDVQFILKRVSTKEKGRRQGAKVKRTNSKLIKQLADFEKSKVAEVEAGSEEVQHMQGNIQALLKIIISQRETIQVIRVRILFIIIIVIIIIIKVIQNILTHKKSTAIRTSNHHNN